MHKALAATAVVAALVGCAHPGDPKGIDLSSPLVACPTGKPIGQVPSCGKVWKLSSGHAKLNKAGELDVQVHGLVLNDASTGEYNGTPDGVDAVAAALVCNGVVATQTEPVALSKTGDASIRANISVPRCLNPQIVLRERYEGKIGGWLAATGM